MLFKERVIKGEIPSCTAECGEEAEILMECYAAHSARIMLCANCAKQLARKLLEDICASETPGGRHG